VAELSLTGYKRAAIDELSIFEDFEVQSGIERFFERKLISI